jgi:RNA polymerase sigma-70 factor (ECF subfamily)
MNPAQDDPARDLALVRDALAHAAVAVRALAERLQCVPRIMAAQNARLGRPLSEHDLADVAQDTMLVLLRKLHEFTGQAALEAWVFRICCLELMNAVRRRRRQMPNIDLEIEPRSDDAATREWHRLVAREALDTAIDRIGGVEAEALRLKHYEGLTFEELAARAGISVTGIKARYYRGLARLEAIVAAQQQKEDVRGRAS